MTYEDAKYIMSKNPEHTPPWDPTPGPYLLQLIPAGHVDPIAGEYSGIMSAIVHARGVWHREPKNVLLRVSSADGSEIYQGPLHR